MPEGFQMQHAGLKDSVPDRLWICTIPQMKIPCLMDTFNAQLHRSVFNAHFLREISGGFISAGGAAAAGDGTTADSCRNRR